MEIKILFSRDEEHYVCDVEIDNAQVMRGKCRMDLCSQENARAMLLKELVERIKEYL